MNKTPNTNNNNNNSLYQTPKKPQINKQKLPNNGIKSNTPTNPITTTSTTNKNNTNNNGNNKIRTNSGSSLSSSNNKNKNNDLLGYKPNSYASTWTPYSNSSDSGDDFSY